MQDGDMNGLSMLACLHLHLHLHLGDFYSALLKKKSHYGGLDDGMA